MGLRGFFVLMSTISFWSLSASALMCSDDINAETSKYLKQGDRITLSSTSTEPIRIFGNQNGVLYGTNLLANGEGDVVSLLRPDLEYPQNVEITNQEEFVVDEVQTDRIILKNTKSNTTYILACGNSEFHGETSVLENTGQCTLIDLINNHIPTAEISVARSGFQVSDEDLCTRENAVVPASHEINSIVQAGPVQRDI